MTSQTRTTIIALLSLVAAVLIGYVAGVPVQVDVTVTQPDAVALPADTTDTTATLADAVTLSEAVTP